MNRTDHQQYTISVEQSNIPPCKVFPWFEKCPECGNTWIGGLKGRRVTVAGTGGSEVMGRSRIQRYLGAQDFFKRTADEYPGPNPETFPLPL